MTRRPHGRLASLLAAALLLLGALREASSAPSSGDGGAVLPARVEARALRGTGVPGAPSLRPPSLRTAAPGRGPREVPRMGRGGHPSVPVPPHPSADPGGEGRPALPPRGWDRWLTPLEQALLAPPAPSAPATGLLPAFPGPGDTGDVIPPDTMGAAGPSHLVALLNSEYVAFRKSDGAVVARSTLDGFWGPVYAASDPPFAADPFDPRILYDAHSGRFVAITLNGKHSPPSHLLLAVSATGDPTGEWNYWAIDAEVDGGSTHTGLWADYPNLGVDDGYVYASTNRFTSSDVFAGTKVWAIPKGPLTAASPQDNLVFYELTDPVPPPPSTLWGDPFNLVPAVTFGTAGAQYFVDEGYTDNVATRPGDTELGDRRYLHVAAITRGSGGSPAWRNLGFVQVPGYPAGGGSWVVPDAPQAGTTARLDCGDTRLQYAVLRDGLLYLVHAVPDGTSKRGEVAWYVVDPAPLLASPGQTVRPLQSGRIRHGSRSYCYPSLAVNGSGELAFGFSGSSPTEYASAYVATRGASDPAGTTRPVLLLKAGEAPYLKTLGGAYNRWGDFSATCVDPSDDDTFWTLQEYAESPANTWGTWWGHLAAAAGQAPEALATRRAGSGAALSWTLPAGSTPTGFAVERRTVPGGDFAVLAAAASLPPDARGFTDNSAASAGQYEYRVVAHYPSGPAVSSEAPYPPPPSGGGGGGGCTVEGDGGSPGTLLPLAAALLLLAWGRRRCRPSREGTGIAVPRGKSTPPR